MSKYCFPTSSLGLADFGMDRPIHPATVHFPFAFLMLGYGLDIYHAISPNLPESITSYVPPTPDLTRASYHLILLGLITFVPAILSGGSQAVQMISKQGLYEADGKTVKEKVKATVAHALTMDLVLAISAYVWSVRRTTATDTLAGKLRVGSLSTPQAAYTPESWMVGAEGLMLALLAFSASIGGKLTYNYGIGFKSLGSVKKTQ